MSESINLRERHIISNSICPIFRDGCSQETISYSELPIKLRSRVEDKVLHQNKVYPSKHDGLLKLKAPNAIYLSDLINGQMLMTKSEI